MKSILMALILVSSSAMAEVSVSTNTSGNQAWIVKDGELYVCAITGPEIACGRVDLDGVPTAPVSWKVES